MTEKPLIIAYYDGDSEVQILSNFARTPFTLDGVSYFSVEAFWQSLKTEYPIMREKIASLPEAFDAKQVGRKIATGSQLFTYQGKLYHVGSPEHHVLLERAIRAKTIQNPAVRTSLGLTGNRPLRHMLKNRFGAWRSGDSPALPASVFEDIWMRIRQELKDGTFKETLPLPKGINEFPSKEEIPS